jgi:undecaprenyl-phosphate 4-deoxy-4-formamido-L-arabinose transferase
VRQLPRRPGPEPTDRVALSVVIPVYNSADCLDELVRRLETELSRSAEAFEVVLVDDDSKDSSWNAISRLAGQHEFLTGLRLRRNAGQDNAIMAGLQASRGELVVIMDDDLQHDPADIRILVDALRAEERDVMYGRFEAKRQAWWKNLGSWLNDRIAVRVLGKPKEVYMSPFKAIRREVVTEVVKYEGPFSYVDGLIFTVTSNIGQVDVAHHERFAGRSNYSLVKSIRVALKLATNFSIVPLRIATLAGGIMSVFAFILGAIFLIKTIWFERMPEGWPSLIVTVLFLGGIQLVGWGGVGEYSGRINTPPNTRPPFTIGARVGADTSPPAIPVPAERGDLTS